MGSVASADYALKDTAAAVYEQALGALDYNLVLPEESYTYYNDIMPLQEVEDDWNSAGRI